MYGAVWSHVFGNKYYPEYAKKLLKNFSEVKDNYPYLFSRDGKMIMWGRSMSYRIASVVPFPLMGLEKEPNTNYGWMRRIYSGVLLQFFQHPELMKDNVPTLGFYGAFEPAVQPYSARGSVYWMAKAFLGLLVPADNPFWTATENEGAWRSELKKDKVYNKFQDSSNILITNYPNIGASEVRAWCYVKAIGANEPFRASENYNRLSYNSAFPWQSDSVPGVVAMNYIIKNKKDEWEPFRLYTFKKFEDGIYYRDVQLETNKNVQFSLADIPLPNGILRVDRNKSTEALDVTVGHYALPKLGRAIKREARTVKGYEVQIIDNGLYQLAMVHLKGWDKMETIDTKGVHPESNESTVINARDEFTPAKDTMYISLMLWKKSGEKWKDDELVPVKKLDLTTANTVSVLFVKGDKKTVKFD
jgi:hypothetical protein